MADRPTYKDYLRVRVAELAQPLGGRPVVGDVFRRGRVFYVCIDSNDDRRRAVLRNLLGGMTLIWKPEMGRPLCNIHQELQRRFGHS